MITSASLANHLATLSGTTPTDPKLRQTVEEVIAKDLGADLDGVVIGWKSAHVEKPAFPFVVAKQGRIYAAEAATQLAENKARAATLLHNPESARLVLGDVEKAFSPTATVPDVADPGFQEYFEATRQASSHASNFTCSATLVNVGWGAGDHENVNSDHCPAGPKTTSAHLAHEIAGIIFTPKP